MVLTQDSLVAIIKQNRTILPVVNVHLSTFDLRSSVDPRDSVQDLTEEERLALFRVGRRRRPTEFQLFSGLHMRLI